MDLYSTACITGTKKLEHKATNHRSILPSNFVENVSPSDMFILDFAHGSYDPIKQTITYEMRLDKLFPASSKRTPDSSILAHFGGLPVVGYIYRLKDRHLSFKSKLSVQLMMTHSQFFTQGENNNREDVAFSQKLSFERDVDFSYNIDESTPKNSLVAGATIGSGDEVKTDWNRSNDQVKCVPFYSLV
ncbi:unnamed protein product [Ambrosiozyma monospora]|uniref:Unnamed protein product n=1 Tax=Ambrosiozyma monospora TaxID=43982 RepID=A0ACB5U6D0_AMBMO|nr:unnamed protein product [Ambrosiozyma monospora]